MKIRLAGLGLAGMLLGGCLTTATHYKSVNGMSYCENCKAIIVGTSESTKIALPSGGYAGASVNLGTIEKSETRADVSKTLGVVNQSLVSTCEGKKAAAFANDRTTYDRWGQVEQNQVVKLQQLEELLVAQERPAGSAPVAAAPAPEPVALAEATPKPSTKKDARLKKWASVYSPKNHGKLKLPAGTKVAAKKKKAAPADAAAQPTPPVVTPEVRAVLETQPKQPQVLGLAPKS